MARSPGTGWLAARGTALPAPLPTQQASVQYTLLGMLPGSWPTGGGVFLAKSGIFAQNPGPLHHCFLWKSEPIQFKLVS